jgi:hypothetical protein
MRPILFHASIYMTSLLEAAQATRLKLREQGYSPIPVEGKIPNYKGWQKLGNISIEELARLTSAHPTAVNTGVLTANMPVLDIDILSPEAAEAAEQLVKDRIGETGRILIRVGKAPKRAIPFQTIKPFPKIAVGLDAPNGSAGQKLELLCDGQQVVVDGIHPDTGKPYTWFGGHLTDIGRLELPYLNETEARTLVQDIAELLVAEYGYKATASRPNKPSSAADGVISHATGSDDWVYLTGNILAGTNLHDSVVSLSAKLLTAGMDAGAVVNFLQGLMAQSAAPRDGRFSERFNDIERIVRDGRAKFGADDEDDEFSDTLPPPRSVSMMTSAEFCASYVPPDYLVEGLLQRKFFYSMTGKTGAGKTSIALLFCALVALGRVLDGRQFEPGRVLYLAGENPVDVQQRWIAMSQQMDFDADAIDVHFIPGVFKISAMQKAIAAEVDRLGGVALVVIDTTAAYFEGDEENSNRKVTTRACNVLLSRHCLAVRPSSLCVTL